MGGHKEEQPTSPVPKADKTEAGAAAKKAPEPNAELDLVFVVDNTGSMGSWIKETQRSIQKIIKDIVAAEKSDVKFALVSYRDHPPQDNTYVTQKHDFTSNLRDMQAWVDQMAASGGGDFPEAVADGLYDALHLAYRPNSAKVCVLVADAPPHGIGASGDAFPNGSPSGHDPLKIAGEMAEKGIVIYSVICGNFEGQAFYQGLCQSTGGQYCPLSSSQLLSQVIVAGAQEEISLERLMKEAAEALKQEQEKEGREFSEDELAGRLQDKMNSRGVQARRVNFQGTDLPEYEAAANAYSACSNLEEFRTKNRSSSAHLARGGWGGGYAAKSAAEETAAPSMSSGFASLNYQQCARMATKAKKRSMI